MKKQKSSKIENERAHRHLEQAYAYLDANDLKSALRECESALHLVPEWAEAHNLRGLVLDELGRVEEAIAAYRKAIELEPGFEEAAENLAEVQSEVSGVDEKHPAGGANRLYSYMGFGSRYYGARDRHSDGSFVTTEWRIFFYLPIVPVSSLRVKLIGSEEVVDGDTKSEIQTYEVIRRLPLDVKQVVKIYGVTLASVAIFLLIVVHFADLFEAPYSRVSDEGCGAVPCLISFLAIAVLWSGPFVLYRAK
jgi:hypothetical protein